MLVEFKAFEDIIQYYLQGNTEILAKTGKDYEILEIDYVSDEGFFDTWGNKHNFEAASYYHDRSSVRRE